MSRPSLAAMAIAIAPAELRHAPAIAEIYGHHVRHGTATFEETPPDETEMRARMAAILGHGQPFLVALAQGTVVGYAYAASYHARSAYRFVLEDSIYLTPGRMRQGIGRQLLSAIIARSEASGYRQMLALIGDSANAASIALHRSLGFNPIGTQRAVGWKFGRWLDVVQMQRPLGEGARTGADEAARP